MAATNEVNFNELVDKDYIKGCLCYNQASLYNGDCGVESAANILRRSNIGTWEVTSVPVRSNIGTWEVTSVPVEPIYKTYTTENDFTEKESESLDEARSRKGTDQGRKCGNRPRYGNGT